MKRNSLLLLALMITISLFGQVPESFKYQAVVRNAEGIIIANQTIGIRISILKDNSNGIVVCSETFTETTNSFGLVNIEIGKNNPSDFSAINWSTGQYFVKVEIDAEGAGAYSEMGTSQLLSVPFAMHAKTSEMSLPQMTSFERDDLAEPENGMLILNTTTNSLNYFNGTQWNEIAWKCTPDPSAANAGYDQSGISELTTTLAANEPEFGDGVWSILSGENGSFTDSTNPTTIFTGSECVIYILKWTISTPCNTTNDEVVIGFGSLPTTANAGPDQTFNNNTYSALLAANNPSKGTGVWSIVSGSGGSFANTLNPSTVFTGTGCDNYTLRWTISTACSSSYDDVRIRFDEYPTIANAGTDHLSISGTSTTLAANTPVLGQGLWSVISGENGTFGNIHSTNSTFTGSPGVKYTLRWTITSACNHISTDEVFIHFDAVACTGFETVLYEGVTYNTVKIGSQCWLAENLRVGTRINSSAVGKQTDNGIIEKFCYNNQESNCAIYGGYYQWNEMMQYSTTEGSRGICPTGWHIPDQEEFSKLISNVSGDGNALKNAGQGSGAGAGTNLSGFSALLSGYTDVSDGSFIQMGLGEYWSSTQASTTTHAKHIALGPNTSSVGEYSNYKSCGYSVRCIKSVKGF